MKNLRKFTALALAALTVAALFSGCTAAEKIFISNADDLVSKKIGVQEGTTGDIFAEDIEGAQLFRFSKGVDAAIDLANGKVDAVILDEEPAKAIVAQNDKLTILPEEFSLEDYAIAVRKDDDDLLASVNDTLARIKSDGTFDSFLNAFIPESGERKPLDKYAEGGSGGTIIMGTNAEFEPFEYRENNSIVGLDVAVAHEIAADLGMTLKIEDMDFKSLILALTSGKIDMILAGMTVTDERLESVNFSTPYYTSKQVIIVRKTSVK